MDFEQGALPDGPVPSAAKDLSTYSVEQSLQLDHRDCLAIFALYDFQ